MYNHDPRYGQWQSQQQGPFQQQGYGYGYGVQQQQAWGGVQQGEGADARLAFLRKTYALFAGAILFSAVAATAATSIGAKDGVPPLVAFFAEHSILGMVLYFGSLIAAYLLRKVNVINVMALFGMASIWGLVFAPLLYVVTLNAAQGGTLSANPVRDGFLITSAMFVGLSVYAFTAKRDFSYLKGALFMGVWVVFAASLIGIFVSSLSYHLAVLSVGALLMGGFILYDTSRILKGEYRNPVTAAIELYCDFVWLFLRIVMILGSRRN